MPSTTDCSSRPSQQRQPHQYIRHGVDFQWRNCIVPPPSRSQLPIQPHSSLASGSLAGQGLFCSTLALCIERGSPRIGLSYAWIGVAHVVNVVFHREVFELLKDVLSVKALCLSPPVGKTLRRESENFTDNHAPSSPSTRWLSRPNSGR